jgi:hypothetical protein
VSQVSESMRLEVIEHLNQTHRQDLTQLVQAFGHAEWAMNAEITDFDFVGISLNALNGSRSQACQIAFATPAQAESEIEELFLNLVEAAREKLGIIPEEKITTDVIGSASHTLSFSSQTIFAALRDVQHYPNWLPPVGAIISSSHEKLQLGSSFTALVRGQDNQMHIDILEYQENTLLYWCENGGHAHAIRFFLEARGQETALSVSVSNRVPIPKSELLENQEKLSKISLVIAQKLETFMAKEVI